MKWHLIILVTCGSLQCVLSSYMGYPRIHFSGRFLADSNLANNDLCSYRPDMQVDVGGKDNTGTNEIELFDCSVTSVVDESGLFSTNDPLVGRGIVGNLKRPLAKMVEQTLNLHTTIFGMKFGLKWSDGYPRKHEDIAFYGKWSRSVLAQFMWERMKCNSKSNHGSGKYYKDFTISAQSTTTITDIDWRNLGNSKVLHQLRDAAGEGGELLVRVTFYAFNRLGKNSSLGYVMGTIGVPNPTDTLSIPGERALFYSADPINLSFHTSDLCFNKTTDYKQWAQLAPLEVDAVRSEIRIDLSNSLPADIYNSIRDLGLLRLGVLLPSSCVLLLGDKGGIPYSATEYLALTSAIYAIPFDPLLLSTIGSHKLVIAQVLSEGEGTGYSCKLKDGHDESASGPDIHIILQEYPYYVRPKGLYVDFLDRVTNPSNTQVVYVTKFGVPVKGVPVTAKEKKIGMEFPLPLGGVAPVQPVAYTDANGLATFEFSMSKDIMIPAERHYSFPPCLHKDNATTLPVDSQVYHFYFCPKVDGAYCPDYRYIVASFLAFADVNYTRPYTWVDDVGPILDQYARVAPMMKRVIDISDYETVTLPHNLNLLKKCMSVDIDDPSYMPTTRDLSPTKRRMILEWLDDPKYDLMDTKLPSSHEHAVCVSCHVVNETTYLSSVQFFSPPRCKLPSLSFVAGPHHYDHYFSNIFTINDAHTKSHAGAYTRPLANSGNCNLASLKAQLQEAIRLEWLTIPVYLTSLYTIKDGYNTQIAHIIRSVVVQEMFHMTQVANILIAINGSPLIDDPSIAPTFPVTGLPGGVLPNLTVTLERLSLEHVYRVFMAIETPQETLVGPHPIATDKATVGEFYKEVRDCIDTLGDDIFDPSSLDRQVKWPWDTTRDMGVIIPVKDSASAKAAISVVISQGEGAGLMDPDQIGTSTLAHFFKFEEVVCQRHLKQIDKHSYAYAGVPIPFDPEGVWPMRPNPSTATTPADSFCYYHSRLFHQLYRNLLHKMQDVFNGHPKEVFTTVQIMESLLVHAKKLTWRWFNPWDKNDHTTCGPVWDYFWNQSIQLSLRRHRGQPCGTEENTDYCDNATY